MIQRSLTIEAQSTATTPSSTTLPTPRAPIGPRGSVSVPEPRSASVQPTADPLPAEARIAPPTAPAAAAGGSSWIAHPLHHRLRAILRVRVLTLEERHAAALAARAGLPRRTGALVAQARLFTSMR